MFPAIQLTEDTRVRDKKDLSPSHCPYNPKFGQDTPVKDVELGSPHCISVMGRWRSGVPVGQIDNPSVRFHVA